MRRLERGARPRLGAGVVALVVATLAAAGCAGRSERREIAASVTEGRAGFTPDTVTVHTGDKVSLLLSNSTDRAHGFDIEGYGLTARVVEPTTTPERIRFTARRAGTFRIYCQLHPTHETATLVVL